MPLVAVWQGTDACPRGFACAEPWSRVPATFRLCGSVAVDCIQAGARSDRVADLRGRVMRVAAVQVCFCCGICHCIRCNALVAWGVQEDDAVHPLSEPADIFEKGSTVDIPPARCLPPPRCFYRVQDSQAIGLYEHACCVHTCGPSSLSRSFRYE